MSHFAEIDDQGIVQRVLVIPDSEEHRGHQFLAVDLLLGGEWIQCSYNGKIRKQYPGSGYTYDPIADVFIAPQPFQSWSLDTNNDWQPPSPMPTTGMWRWDDAALAWVEVVV